jgi:hypothetical protein
VNPIPLVTPIANATFCNGTSSNLITINGTGTSYAWTNWFWKYCSVFKHK